MKNYLSNELFERIKAEVSMEQVLEQYGMQVRRHLCTCPFHKDGRPSMRVYANSFYCFSCGAGGDVTKFVAKYLNISNMEAAKIIAKDYGIYINIDTPTDYAAIRRKEQERQREAAFKAWIKQAQSLLCEEHRRLLADAKAYAPNADTYDDRFVYAIKTLPKIAAMLDILDSGDYEDLIDFYKTHRKEVEALGNTRRAAG